MIRGTPGRAAPTTHELDAERRTENVRIIGLALAAIILLLGAALWLGGAPPAADWLTLVVSLGAIGCALSARRIGPELGGFLLSLLVPVAAIGGSAYVHRLGTGPYYLPVGILIAAATLRTSGVVVVGVASLGGLVVLGLLTDFGAGEQLGVRALIHPTALTVLASLMAYLHVATNRRALEQAVADRRRLEEGEARFRLIGEHARELVALLTLDGVCLYANASYERVLGLKPADLVGRATWNQFDPADLPRAMAGWQSLREGGYARETLRTRHVDGSLRWLDIALAAFDSDGQRLVAAIGRDVTEERRLAAELEQAHRLEALGRLSGAVAHDFNNLLTVIQTCAEYARRRVGHDPEVGPALADILASTDRAAALTGQLLAFARREELPASVVDVAAAVAGISQLLPRALGSGISLELQLPGSLGPIRAPRVQLEQVLLNLAVNARDAMPEGGQLVISGREYQVEPADPRSLRPGPYVELSIRDSGIGMSAEVQARIFEPFFTTKAPGAGTGLGLATSYGIATRLGGTLTVESRPGAGSTFRLLLPRAAGEPEQEPPPPVKAGAPPASS